MSGVSDESRVPPNGDIVSATDTHSTDTHARERGRGEVEKSQTNEE